jgi:hypothetical protein
VILLSALGPLLQSTHLFLTHMKRLPSVVLSYGMLLAWDWCVHACNHAVTRREISCLCPSPPWTVASWLGSSCRTKAYALPESWACIGCRYLVVNYVARDAYNLAVGGGNVVDGPWCRAHGFVNIAGVLALRMAAALTAYAVYRQGSP